ncbi:MAG: signal transduction histidine kinase, nitrogen specific, NtrB [Gemmatimonadetes bacterium]|nr:signal transduction histidine kinase, nitrogen specific, NtrB [Gemmatimonadota bacterium]
MRIIQAFRRSRRLAELPAPSVPASIVDRLPDGVVELTSDDIIIAVNLAAARMFGRSDASLRGLRLSDVLSVTHPAGDSMALRTGGNRYHARFVRGDGDQRIAEVAVSRTDAAPSDGVASHLVTLRDVTEQWEAWENLARSESRYRHLFEGASDAIMTFDAFGRFTTVNDAGEAISGYPRGELIGRFFGPLLAIDALPRAVLEFRRALSGNAGQFETVMLRKDGERRHITVNYACPERSREVLCMIRDATQEKQLQLQLIQSEKMAAIGQLVSGVAHEINNPLAGISGFAQLLLADKSLTPDAHHSAEVISGEARRAARIVHNLLTFARQHAAEKASANVNAIVENTLELRAYEVRVRGTELVCELDPAIPDTVVDVYQIQQVLLNLVTNAEHAMANSARHDHRLTVRTRALGGTVRIEVEDTGGGIPPHSVDLIFNPFFTTKPTGQGTGLGLSISLGIVSEHGGRIWVDNVGGGARFTVELPVTAAGASAVPARRLPQIVRPGLRVLVADDEEPIRMALDRFLASQGHTPVTVSSGNEAVWRAEGDEEFDTIILDMRMPDLSGRQIFEQWRINRPDLSDRVVFLTGDIVSPDLQAFLAGTERPYLSKPFDFTDVVASLGVPKGRLRQRWKAS